MDFGYFTLSDNHYENNTRAANQLVVHGIHNRFTEVTAVMHVSGSNRTALARGSALHLYFDGRP